MQTKDMFLVKMIKMVIAVFNKRGISPIIATVLLIAITVVLMVVIIGWSSKFVEDKGQKSQAEVSLGCSNVDFKVFRACSNNNKIMIENRGENSLGFKVAVDGGSVSSCSGLVRSYEKKEITCSGLSGGTSVKIIPLIGKTDCSNKLVKINIKNDC